jgi:oligogalacturonide lyase
MYAPAWSGCRLDAGLRWLSRFAPWLALAAPLAGRAEPPREWIDPDTGHRVVRLSDEAGAASLYFHQWSFTPDGRSVVVTTPHGIALIDHTTRALTPLVSGDAKIIQLGRRTGDVFYTRTEGDQAAVFVFSLASRTERRLALLPPRATISTVNSDETLLAGTLTETEPPAGELFPPNSGASAKNTPQGEWMKSTDDRARDGRLFTFAEQKERRLARRLAARLPMAIFTVAVADGELRIVHRATDWLNHLQFSPADPGQLMFCHEGPWHMVDRLWLIRTDGSGLTKVHTRTMNMEIAGHEFFAPDGRTVWYDLQTPRGESFWLASYDLATGARTRLHVERNAWSVHFNVSADGARFAGDGGDAEMVAHAPDGKWLYLFNPEAIPDVAELSAPDAADLIRPGVLRPTRLVNMKTHNYRLEPNAMFTPDGRKLVFRSNLHGEVHVYAVDLAPAAPPPAR